MHGVKMGYHTSVKRVEVFLYDIARGSTTNSVVLKEWQRALRLTIYMLSQPSYSKPLMRKYKYIHM